MRAESPYPHRVPFNASTLLPIWGHFLDRNVSDVRHGNRSYRCPLIGAIASDLRHLPPEVSGLQHFHSLVSPATFPPTECLMAPASYCPRAVRRGDEHRTWTSVPLRDALLGDWVLFRRRVPLLLSTGPGPSKQSLALARRGRGEMRRGQRRADRTGESASATWANKATALICRRSTSRHVRQRNCTFCPVFAPCAGYVTVAGE